MDVIGLGDNLRVGHVGQGGQGGQVISLATSALERSILLAKRAVRPFPSQMVADGQQAWFESVFKERIDAPLRTPEALSGRINIHPYTTYLSGHFQEFSVGNLANRRVFLIEPPRAQGNQKSMEPPMDANSYRGRMGRGFSRIERMFADRF